MSASSGKASRAIARHRSLLYRAGRCRRYRLASYQAATNIAATCGWLSKCHDVLSCAAVDMVGTARVAPFMVEDVTPRYSLHLIFGHFLVPSAPPVRLATGKYRCAFFHKRTRCFLVIASPPSVGRLCQTGRNCSTSTFKVSRPIDVAE